MGVGLHILAEVTGPWAQTLKTNFLIKVLLETRL